MSQSIPMEQLLHPRHTGVGAGISLTGSTQADEQMIRLAAHSSAYAQPFHHQQNPQNQHLFTQNSYPQIQQQHHQQQQQQLASDAQLVEALMTRCTRPEGALGKRKEFPDSSH